MSQRVLGIDLSTKKIGICLLEEKTPPRLGEVRMWTHNLKNRKFDKDTAKELFDMIPSGVSKIFVEIGNYGNAAMTQKFAYLAGMLHKTDIEIKCISPSSWFEMLLADFEPHLKANKVEREQRKKLSVQWCRIVLDVHSHPLKDSELTDDMTDAFWVAWYGKDAPDYFQTKKQKQKEARQRVRALQKQKQAAKV